MGAPDIELICDELRAGGARITRSLRDVLSVLAAGDDHLTATDIVERLRQTDSRAQIATVYRTLERLSASNVVEHVHLGHGALAYHLRPKPHGHVVCESCGKVIDIPPTLLAPLAAQLDRQQGFALRTGHTALSGWCADCRELATGSARSRRSSP